MDITEIEQLVSIVRDARISELVVETDSPKLSKIRIRKTLSSAKASAISAAGKASAPLAVGSGSDTECRAATDVFIVSPMVGIFHSMDSMSVPGALVKAGRTVGTIESMKLMNDVLSESDGFIAEILIEDGMPVEYGQNLFRLAHAAPEASA